MKDALKGLSSILSANMFNASEPSILFLLAQLGCLQRPMGIILVLREAAFLLRLTPGSAT